MNDRFVIRFIFAAVLMCGIGLLVWPLLAQAGSELPPRDPIPVSPQKDDDDDDDDDGGDTPIGAYIELQTQSVSGGWAVVQWQDSGGNWQDVEGWQGPVDSSRRWWVAAKDFGKSSFRWAVTEGSDGQLLGASQPFSLPTSANEVIFVQVSVQP